MYKDNGLATYVTSDLESDETPINLYGTTFIGLEVGEEGFDYDKLISIQNLSNKCNIQRNIKCKVKWINICKVKRNVICWGNLKRI